MVGFENVDFALVFAWFLEPRFGVGFENVDFALVSVWFLEGSVRKPHKNTRKTQREKIFRQLAPIQVGG